MANEPIHVIATTISGSVKDWSKVARIQPLFAEHGFTDVRLIEVDSHRAAREQTRAVLVAGARVIISAGGSGTFNAVLEGCCDSGVPLGEIRLGFLRKGSADLIGKVLNMPDDIESAIQVFADSIRAGCTVPCDVLLASSPQSAAPDRHFVGYGGAALFGRIPHFTESRFIKWYKGIFGLIFGDLGPFMVGLNLAVVEKLLPGPFGRGPRWRIRVDGAPAAEGRYHALILVNGYLGPEMPYSSDPLGSGRFHLFALRDLGLRRFLGQIVKMKNGSILEDPAPWGLESYAVTGELVLEPDRARPFPLNVDGSTMICAGSAVIRRTDVIPLISHS